MHDILIELETLLTTVPKDDKLSDYKKERFNRWRNRLGTLFSALEEERDKLQQIIIAQETEQRKMKLINELFMHYGHLDIQQMKRLCSLLRGQHAPPRKQKLVLPEAISPEINADYDELQRCFDAGCYRAAIILCGRILETALHRKYFELTGKDVLETNPGMGLGKVLAKIKELNYDFGPGITEQIHLINQVRINSVHQKQNAFLPTKEQAQATVLYMLDVLKKLF
ncbi:hypothetical protein HY639_00740 [Candidatus Woesearchaeota archaeon]|nr:hypothetical protein [Candidatus Woesearchaeota archaeon]